MSGAIAGTAAAAVFVLLFVCYRRSTSSQRKPSMFKHLGLTQLEAELSNQLATARTRAGSQSPYPARQRGSLVMLALSPRKGSRAGGGRPPAPPSPPPVETVSA